MDGHSDKNDDKEIEVIDLTEDDDEMVGVIPNEDVKEEVEEVASEDKDKDDAVVSATSLQIGTKCNRKVYLKWR